MTATSPAPFYGGLDLGVPFQIPMTTFTLGPHLVWNPPQDFTWYVLQKIDVVWTESSDGDFFKLSIDYAGTLIPFHSAQVGTGTVDHFPWYGPLAILHGQTLNIETVFGTVALTASGVAVPQFSP